MLEERVGLLDTILRPLLGVQGFGYRAAQVGDAAAPPPARTAAEREARLRRQLDGLAGVHVRVRTVQTSAGPDTAGGQGPG